MDTAKGIAAFAAGGGDSELGQRIEDYVERGDPDSEMLFATLFTATGVRFARAADGLKLR